MSKQRVFLLATGSFNPPTVMHLRIMELARDHLHKLGFSVVGGAITPVHDGYGKKGLEPAQHRLNMVKLALQNNEWVKLSSWEATKNNTWLRTRMVVEHHQKILNEYLKGKTDELSDNDWLPDPSQLDGEGPVQLKLVCGADYLESFNTKDLWTEEDMMQLTRDHGFVVICREGSNPLKSIWTSDILNSHLKNIHIVHEWITNDISSTQIRLAVRRSESIRYLVPDSVVDYIRKHQLYVHRSQKN